MSANVARIGIIKQAWNNIPDIVAGSVLGLVGIGMAVVGVAGYYAKDGDNRRYKMSYVVMRPDDPRAAKVHKD